MVKLFNALDARALMSETIHKHNEKDIERIFEEIRNAASRGKSGVTITVSGDESYVKYLDVLLRTNRFQIVYEKATQYPYDRYFLGVSW